jgi:hypothetical protein
MATTTNLKLSKPATSDTVSAFLSAHNANMDTLDALPIPCGSVTSGTMTALKLADGTCIIYGVTTFKNVVIGPNQYSGAYISPNEITVNWPIAVNGTPTVLARCYTNLYSDVSVYNVAVSETQWIGRFSAPFDESAHPYFSDISEKYVHIIAIARWK